MIELVCQAPNPFMPSLLPLQLCVPFYACARRVKVHSKRIKSLKSEGAIGKH